MSVHHYAAMSHRFPSLLLFFLLLLSPSSSAAASFTSPIRTVVVLVMENRSFDHILGWMKNLIPSLDGVSGQEWNPLNVADPSSPRVYFSDQAEFVDPDPGHSFGSIREQIFGGFNPPPPGSPAPMSGFATNAERIVANLSSRVMSGFRPEVLPAYASLAQEFAVADRWFASVPTSTQPNRLYVHSGTSHGLASNHQKRLFFGLPQRTIFHDVLDAGLSVGVYFQSIPTVLFYSRLRSLRFARKLHLWNSFARDAAAGNLPNYVCLEPIYFDLPLRPANDDHPSHDVSEGQKFVKEVYDTLRKSPQWNETLLIITYDEHGGFYDHVPTPLDGVPNPDGLNSEPLSFNFDRLGVRVPTLLISPWINKATVLHAANGPTPTSQFEHSSIPATVRKLFGLTTPPLSKREAWAASFDSLVRQRSTPRTDCPGKSFTLFAGGKLRVDFRRKYVSPFTTREELPETPWSLRHAPPDESRPITEFQSELVELADGILGGSWGRAEKAKKTVGEANAFVEEAVKRFLSAAEAAANAGVDENTIVRV